MSTVAEWRTGIATNLATIKGLNTYAAERAQVAIPAATVLVPPITYYGEGATMGPSGLIGTVRIPVMINVGAQITDEGAQLLAQFASPSGPLSIPTAVRVDPTLGGSADDCICESFRPMGIDEYAAVNYWGGIFTILVAALRD